MTKFYAAERKRQQGAAQTQLIPAALEIEATRVLQCASQEVRAMPQSTGPCPYLKESTPQALHQQRELLPRQRGLDLFQRVDIFLQAGDMVLHFNKR